MNRRAIIATAILFISLTSCSNALKFKIKDNESRPRSPARSPVKYRPLSFLELQPHLLWYGLTISSISPVVWGYQMSKLNPQVKTTVANIAMLSLSVIPTQALLKMLQLNLGTPIKRHLNPWCAFACMGAIQGGVTGQASVFFSRAFGIGNPKLTDALRGYQLSALKDTIAQGLPFAFSDLVQHKLLDRLLPSSSTSSWLSSIKRGIAVVTTSALGTVLSQICQNLHFALVSSPGLSYTAAAKQLWDRNGVGMFFNGAASRLGLVLVVSVLNQAILKQAWQGVPVPLSPRMLLNRRRRRAMLPRQSARHPDRREQEKQCSQAEREGSVIAL
eukprot:CAMPEP_0196744476 /NCGR_PEP_ID=MMETSP1091-20130531/57731_1 /TAXON_ID=302021 /ORGANISM="Rhodomonas sp., Strain CCMP768" /LENGTH=330 /DNA_ID=CAMNT_0042091033 /DNA_START=131 /DNA_END=1123 /DNA_ORIENTATION=+